MNLGIVMLVLSAFVPVMVIFWNKQKVKGKILCFFVRKDKSVLGQLCSLRSDFVIFQDRAYDIYPDLVRVARFPMGWPSILQEAIPCSLYDEEDAIPLDWINLGEVKERSMNLRSALDENWVKKLVHEAAVEGGGFQINWRKMIPIALIILGVLGLVALLVMKGCAPPGAPVPPPG